MMCSIEQAVASELLHEMDDMTLQDDEIDTALDVFENDDKQEETYYEYE